MSRCSLQLYVNENFTFSRPSLASSDDLLKNVNGSSDWKRSSLTSSHTDKDVLYKLIDRNCFEKKLNDIKNEGYHPILTKYLLRHTRSVEAYRRIRKQQEEILVLCRKKLAKKISESFLSGIRDEDIIRALKIIQDTELEITKPHSSDEVIQRIIKGIVSEDGGWNLKSVHDGKRADENRVLKPLPHRVSYSSGHLPKLRKRYSAVFRKLRAVFKRRRSYASTLTLPNKFTNQLENARAILAPLENKLIYPYHLEGLPRNLKLYKAPVYGKSPRQPHPRGGMGSKSTCACHRNLVKLQNEFVKQQSEIRLINQNLEQCLCILHDIGDKPSQRRRPGQHHTSAFRNDTQILYSVSPQSGPYGDRYYDYRSPERNSYQVTTTHTYPKRTESFTPKTAVNTGGGWTDAHRKIKIKKTKKKEKVTCPTECPYGKIRTHQDSRMSLVHQLEEEGIIKPTRKSKPKRTFCGCCSRTNASSTPTSTTIELVPVKPKGVIKTEIQSIPSTVELSRPTPPKIERPPPIKVPPKKSSKKCCAKRRPVPPVCNQVCTNWSDVELKMNMVSVAAQTSLDEYPLETPRPEVGQPTKGKIVRCTKRDCSKKGGKSKQCQCVNCKSARRAQGQKSSTPSTLTSTPSTTSARDATDSSGSNRPPRFKKSRSRLGLSTTGIGRSQSRLGFRRSRIGESKGNLGKSRSRLGKSRSNVGKSRSRFGRSSTKVRKTKSRTGARRQSTVDDKESVVSGTSDASGASGTSRGSSEPRICTDKPKPKSKTKPKTKPKTKSKTKQPCFLVRFCKLYICRG